MRVTLSSPGSVTVAITNSEFRIPNSKLQARESVYGERALDLCAHGGKPGGFEVEPHHIALADPCGHPPAGGGADDSLELARHPLVVDDHSYQAFDPAGVGIAAGGRRIGIRCDEG